ncbi:MAG: hypothetical protein ACOC10_00005, partial [Bacteroidota bacterium]
MDGSHLLFTSLYRKSRNISSFNFCYSGISSFLNPDTLISIKVDQTYPIHGGLPEPMTIKNVVLFENESELLLTQYENNTFLSASKPKTGSIYQLNLNIDGHNEIHTKTSIPSRISVHRADYRFPAYISPYETRYGLVNVSFIDESQSSNFYEIFFLRKDSNFIHNFIINDPILSVNTEEDANPPRTLLFSDAAFEKDTVTLQIFVESSLPPTIILRNVIKSYYDYRTTLELHLRRQHTNRSDIFDFFKGDP